MNIDDRKNNNSGSTLIMVIVVIAFIGILGSLVISMTMINIQMKTIDAQSKENFYETESIMQDVKGRLEEIAAEQMKSAYEEVLKNYVSYVRNGQSPSNMFDELYLKKLKIALTADGTETGTTYNIDTIKQHIKFPDKFLTSASDGDNLIVLHYAETYPANDRYVELKNIKIQYINENNKQLTNIKTNIRMYPPGLAFGTSAIMPEFSNYTIIANDQLTTSSNNASSIRGNIYAGAGGIQCTIGKLNLVGNTVITRGNVSVINNAELNIGDSTSGSSTYTTVWAENITTERLSRTSTDAAKLNIYGDCNVSNDLIMNAQNSQVSIKGNYFGYSFNKQNIGESTPGYTDSLINSNYSSAIIINGKNCSLDLSAVNTLYLVGHTYVSVGGTGSDDILMGQSFGVKSDQTMYLVPSEYMRGNCNPMMESAFNAAGRNINNVIDIPDDFNTDWLDREKVAMNYYTFAGVQSVYFYWKFKDQDSANAYFQYICDNEDQKKDLENNMVLYINADKGVKLNASTIMNSGHIYSVDATTGSMTLVGTPYTNPDSPDAMITNLCISKALEYQARQLVLAPTSSEVTSANIRLDDKTYLPMFNRIISHTTVTDSFIKNEANNADVNGFNASRIKVVNVDRDASGAVDSSVICIDNETGGAFSVSKISDLGGMYQGIIVATGDVNIDTNFTGLIIARGKISIQNSAQVNANNDMIKEILQYGIEHYSTSTPTTNFIHYFDAYKAGTSGRAGSVGTANLSSSIKFNNWKKNED